MINTINHYNYNKLDAGMNNIEGPTFPATSGGKPLGVLPTDQVSLSDEARRLQAHGRKEGKANYNEENLSNEEKKMVSELKKRDVAVKNHEAAHMSAGGTVVQGGASYQYQSGPDGRMYAVGGEVKIDLSSEGTPEATIHKMQEVRRAAMAPAQPSGTDRAVAAQATQIEIQARIEKNEQAKEESKLDENSEPFQNHTVHPFPSRSIRNFIGKQINLNV